jgi:membrane-anchored glycerophosphoryl diester phosphodiesterase (GDPDase)
MVTGEAAKVATGFMHALQNEPLSLALCIMNFSLIGFVYFQSVQFNSQRADNVKLFTDVQREVQKLLSECIVPPRQQRGQAPESSATTSISHGERDDR